MKKKQIYKKFFKSLIYAILPTLLIIVSVYSLAEIQENVKAKTGDKLMSDKWNGLLDHLEDNIQEITNSKENMKKDLEKINEDIKNLENKINEIDIDNAFKI